MNYTIFTTRSRESCRVVEKEFNLYAVTKLQTHIEGTRKTSFYVYGTARRTSKEH